MEQWTVGVNLWFQPTLRPKARSDVLKMAKWSGPEERSDLEPLWMPSWGCMFQLTFRPEERSDEAVPFIHEANMRFQPTLRPGEQSDCTPNMKISPNFLFQHTPRPEEQSDAAVGPKCHL